MFENLCFEAFEVVRAIIIHLGIESSEIKGRHRSLLLSNDVMLEGDNRFLTLKAMTSMNLNKTFENCSEEFSSHNIK